MSKVEYNGKVTDEGILIVHNKPAFSKEVGVFKGKDVTITVQRKARKRSNPQIRYWWSVVVPLVRDTINDTGEEYSKENIHEFLKSQFLYKEFIDHSTGEIHRIPRELKAGGDVTTFEFMECIDGVSRWAAQTLNLVIPLPEEQSKMF